jgi:hypothetical protein
LSQIEPAANGAQKPLDRKPAGVHAAEVFAGDEHQPFIAGFPVGFGH